MQTNNSYDMHIPTHVLFGAGMLNQLSEQPMPGKKALIVISNGKSTRANLFEPHRRATAKGGY